MTAAPTRAECLAALEALALAASGFTRGRGKALGRARLQSAIAEACRLVRAGKPASTCAARRAPRS